MSYEHSTASSMHDLLDKLRIFLLAEGWTVNQYAVDSQQYQTHAGLTATGSYRLHVQKILGPTGDSEMCYFNFRSAERLVLFEASYTSSPSINSRYYGEVRGIGINGSTGYSGAGNWDKEPGAPVDTSNSKGYGGCITEIPLASSFYYWFFTIGDTVAVVVSPSTDEYQFMIFGRLKKTGVYPGGAFYVASCNGYHPSYSYWSTSGGKFAGNRTSLLTMSLAASVTAYGSAAVQLTLDGASEWRHNGYPGLGSTYASCIIPVQYTQYNDLTVSSDWRFIGWPALRATPNTLNAGCPMIPWHIVIKNAASRWQYVGEVEGLRVINCTPYAGGETFVLGATGGDTWMVFPQHRKSADTYPLGLSTVYNFESGVAIKVVA